MKFFRFLIGTFFLVMAPHFAVAMTAVEVLSLANTADKRMSYRGTKVAKVYYAREQATSTVKVIHLQPDLTRTEFFTPRAIAGIIIIRNGSQIWKYSPEEKAWEAVNFTAKSSEESVRNEVLANYKVSFVGDDKVAGRPSYVIQINPKRADEKGRRMWVDKKKFFILKTQIESPSGDILNSSYYTSIEFDPSNLKAQAFEIKGPVKHSRKCDGIDFKVIKPSYTPKGYSLLRVCGIQVSGKACAHLQYSNGVSTISIFERKSSKDAPPTLVENRISNVLTWASNGFRYTIMGDVSKAEIEKMAQTMKP